MTKLKPFAFVLMPFAKEFDDIYKLGIQAVAKELDVVAERVDEQIFSESMLERIYRQVDAADFIVADMSGRNPNVFYEVGYAHAKGKLCTLLTSSADDIPFDLKHHRHLVYGNSIGNLRTMLTPEIAWLKEEADRRKTSPVSVIMKSARGSLVKGEYTDEGHLDLIVDIHNRTQKKTSEIEAIYLYTAVSGWRFFQSSEECPSIDEGVDDYKRRHFLKVPVNRLSPDAWAQLRISAKQTFWSKFLGDERKTKYSASGRILLEIITSEGSFRETLNLDVDFEEFPF